MDEYVGKSFHIHFFTLKKSSEFILGERNQRGNLKAENGVME